MTDLIADILRIAREMPKVETTKIIIMPFGMLPTPCIKWEGHGILWVSETVWAKVPNVTIRSGEQLTRLYSIPAEQFSYKYHGELWMEFAKELMHRPTHNID